MTAVATAPGVDPVVTDPKNKGQQDFTVSVAEQTQPSDKVLSLDNHYGLHSDWESVYNPIDEVPHGRYEAEADQLVVFGEIPESIEGTFYRVHPDANVLPPDNYPFVDGDGIISAFRIRKGQVSMKIKYIETERYLLERQAGKRLFGRYRNPWDNHPCLRLANDATANTNVIYWAGDLLAFSERSLPYSLDPDTMETKTYDPYGSQVLARTFSAHPKIDCFSNELVTWSYTAKGLHSRDVVTYSVDLEGKCKNEFWYQVDKIGWPHDGWVTKNWVILSDLPFTDQPDEILKQPDADFWIYEPDRPQGFLIAPRYPDTPRPHGWKQNEFRKYIYDPCLIIHGGNAWEEEDGTLRLESPLATFNAFPFWNPPGYQPTQIPTSNWVRWTIDLTQPSGTKLPEPQVLYEGLTEFPSWDERYTGRKTRFVYFNGIGPGPRGDFDMIEVIKLDTETRESQSFHAATGGAFAEPVFIPRSLDAAEGDGYVLFYSHRPSTSKGELILLDTNNFSKPLAIVQLPFRTRNQVHGNWVSNPNPGKPLPPLGKPLKHVRPTARGPLVPVP